MRERIYPWRTDKTDTKVERIGFQSVTQNTRINKVDIYIYIYIYICVCVCVCVCVWKERDYGQFLNYL